MNGSRVWILAMSAALLVAGCSEGEKPRAAASPSASRPSPSAAPSSAFCLDLEAFQVGAVVFRADVGGAAEGRRLDFKDLRKRAAILLYMGERMQASAPPGIAERFRAVLKAIRTAARKLKAGSKVRDVVDPLYGKAIQPAFEAVDHYECPGAGG
ncbi:MULTISPECIES: hypothetical protein [Actinomadura]|uniref:DUF732 domain-containing protein n=1 Tax=Actinomadura yumaensis TaxID=111807 RepID=A0ABW2CVD2_9ACTN|nr:hypothetical protein [Actinomadura sp. J1-007]MWK37683.1 hypothetical protein [Actinomadura sp. J1-007]